MELLEYSKPKTLPRVANEDKQAEFIAFYQNLMTKLPADEAVYFADAVHPEHQTNPAYGWMLNGSNPAVKTTAGRCLVSIPYSTIYLKGFDVPYV